ncbi:hypothetical protein MMC19_006519 [Ptychographa xylographoides]|nr:hypothetical protein [Ptychographa xylographoides]
MALAYCWGLVQAIYLMGHGLVAVPRRLFRNARASRRLRSLQSRAPKVHDKLEDALTELGELESQVVQLSKRKTGISRDHQEWVDELVDFSNQEQHCRFQLPLPQSSRFPVPVVLTDRYLADLTRKMTRARHKRIRFTEEWLRLVHEAADIQLVIDATASKRLIFPLPRSNASLIEKITILSPYLRYLLYCQVLPLGQMACGAVLAVASIFIIWSELVKFALPQLSVISFTILYRGHSEVGKLGFGGQMIAFLWLFYMCFTALASFDDVKVWGNRALVRRNTYGESACWYAAQIAKLTVPLAYNFVTFLPRPIYQETIFHQFLGRLIILTPLGKGFDYFFPIFILVPVCATFFNLYGRVKSIFGFGLVEDDEEYNPSGFGTGGWREGRDLIERELGGRSHLESSTPLDGHTISRPSRLPVPITAGINVKSQSPLQSETSRVPNLPSGQYSTARRQVERRSDAVQVADEEEDASVLSGFANRVRNTLDAVDRPDWLPDLARRPKWMGGAGNSGESSAPTESGQGLGRWFGGRPTNGRLRL